MEAGHIMALIQAQHVDNAIKLIADCACLELVDDIVIAKIITSTEAALKHVLSVSEGLERKLSGARCGRGGSISKLLLDGFDKILVALLCLGISSRVEGTRIAHKPEDAGVAEDGPQSGGGLKPGIRGKIASGNARSHSQRDGEEDAAHGKPDEDGDWNQYQSGQKRSHRSQAGHCGDQLLETESREQQRDTLCFRGCRRPRDPTATLQRTDTRFAVDGTF